MNDEQAMMAARGTLIERVAGVAGIARDILGNVNMIPLREMTDMVLQLQVETGKVVHAHGGAVFLEQLVTEQTEVDNGK